MDHPASSQRETESRGERKGAEEREREREGWEGSMDDKEAQLPFLLLKRQVKMT